MIKKEIKFTDFNGEERTEDFYFNLSKAELAEMEVTTEGGLKNRLEKIIESKDNKEIFLTFKDIIKRAFGVKSEDGRRFIKSEEMTEEFMQTEAFSELFVQLAENPDEANAFISGVIPKVENKVNNVDPKDLPKFTK